MNADREHDRRLAARAGAGDEQAFAELVARHREPLRRYVARRFGAELAEDAVQEALVVPSKAEATATPTPEKERERKRKRRATPTPVATVVFARATPAATATPRPKQKATPAGQKRRPAKRYPAAVSFPVGGEWQRTPNGTRVLVGRAAKPTPTPTPIGTPPPPVETPPAVTPAPTP